MHRDITVFTVKVTLKVVVCKEVGTTKLDAKGLQHFLVCCLVQQAVIGLGDVFIVVPLEQRVHL